MKLFKVTNIRKDRQVGYEAEGRMGIIEPEESIMMRKPPKAIKGILTVEEVVDEKVSMKSEEKIKKPKNKTTNKEDDK